MKTAKYKDFVFRFGYHAVMELLIRNFY